MIEAVLDELRRLGRVVDGVGDAHADPSQTARGALVGQQIVRQDSVQVENRIAVESDVGGIGDEKLDRVLVVEDHLRVEPASPFRFTSKLDQPLGVEQ